MQDEWMTYAKQIYAIQGNDTRNSEPGAILYEPDLLVSARIDESVHFMRRQDIFNFMSILRDGIACNKFNEGLFSRVLLGNFSLQIKNQPKMYE